MRRHSRRQVVYLMQSVAIAVCLAAAVGLGLRPVPAHAAEPETAPPPPTVIVAEGESFTLRDDQGWAVTPQDNSLASHTYGGMWVSHGAVLGASADSVGSVAERTVPVPVAGDYRVWSKYQAPPYYNYLHRIELLQDGKVVFSHDYGKSGTDRLWSFSAESNELWWYWGVDHDTAEAPPEMTHLAAGDVTIRLTTLANPAPAGQRMVDFVVLTTNPASDYEARKPYRVATPFGMEAVAATHFYMRFRNSTDAAAVLTLSRSGHWQPAYGGARATFPAEPVAAGAWSAWYDIGQFVRLVHNEGLGVALPGATTIEMEFARDAAGTQAAGAVQALVGDVVNIPIDVVWNTASQVAITRELSAALVRDLRARPAANGGKKPREFLFYGAFSGPSWVYELKDAMGYNTLLPDTYEHVAIDGSFQHAGNLAAVEGLAKRVKDVSKQRIVSFGDEIHMGHINYADASLQAPFVAWLQARGLTAEDLGVAPTDAVLADADASPRLAWYAQLFGESQRFAAFRELTKQTEALFGPQVLTGANFSPHGSPQYYGSIGQWIDLFRADGMTMYWSEDYVFSVPEVPQIVSWHLAMMRAAVRYNHQPIHYYVMPHAPGQPASMLRRGMLFAAGNGASQIDSFWVAAQENYTENYIAWNYPESFAAVHDAIYQTAEVEQVLIHGTPRPTRVALLLSKATQINEEKVKFDKSQDPFTARCNNADPNWMKQTLCRKEQQALYLALRQAQYDVDLITEDDITGRDALASYDVVYVAGEWIDRQVVPRLTAWVEAGGTLYASAGIGHLNQFGEAEPAMLTLLGLQPSPIDKRLYLERPLLELPLADTVDTVTLGDVSAPMIGWRQVLVPAAGQGGAIVTGTWADGSAAVTRRALGKGVAIAVGGLPGLSWQKSGLKAVPFARGGSLNLYHPTGFDAGATRLTLLGIVAGPEGREVARSVVCSVGGVEGRVLDLDGSSVLTLVSWNDAPLTGLTVQVRLAKQPSAVRSVSSQKDLPFTWADGVATVTLDLPDADYLMFKP